MLKSWKTIGRLSCKVVFVLTILCANAVAEPGDIVFSGAPSSASPGDEFSVIIELDAGDLKYQSSTLVFQFPPALLELKAIATETSPVQTSTRPGFPAPPTSGLDESGLFAIRGVETSFSLTGNIELHRLTFGVLVGAATGGVAEINLVAADSRNSIFGRMDAGSPGEQITLGTSSAAMISITPGEPDPCTLTVSGGSTIIPAAGGTTAEFSIDVSSDTCAWTVSSSVGSTSMAGATGDGSFTVTVPENTDSVPRTVIVTVAPEGNAEGAMVLSITQAAPDIEVCRLMVFNGSESVSETGGTTEAFYIEATSDTCSWTVETSLGTSSIDGATGDAEFAVTVPANTGASRTIIVTVTPETGDPIEIDITQEGAPEPCTLTVSDGSTSIPATGGTTAEFSVDVTADTCAWTVTSSVGSTSIGGAAGDGTFTVTVPANTNSASRTVTLTVVPEGNEGGEMVVSITQAALAEPCTTAPPVAQNLSATTTLFDRVTLTWDASPGATSYEILRDFAGEIEFSESIGTTSQTTFDDVTALGSISGIGCACSDLSAISYTYWVIAINDCGPSSPSNPAIGNATKSTSSVGNFVDWFKGAILGNFVLLLVSGIGLFSMDRFLKPRL